MLKTLEKLCCLDGTSGDERTVRDFIISQIEGFCEYRVDNLGNIIAFKKGKNRSKKKLMLDAHMDEVGIIITAITEDGFLKFTNVGGIDTAVMLLRRVLINGKTLGVISGKPIHLLGKEEGKKLPKKEALYIDIGAKTKAEAEGLVAVGDSGVMCSDFELVGDKILSKALDDRVGCAVLIDLIRRESEYDFFASFSVGEEVGLRGAHASAFAIAPDSAVILEGTTAADIAGVSDDKRVCILGEGAAVSFMDGSTVYDREYFKLARESGIKNQPKAAVSGGNNAGAVHLSREGVKTVALSVPCRYIHSASSVADVRDIKALSALAEFMILKIAGEGL